MGRFLVLILFTLFSLQALAWQNMMMNTKHAGNPLVGPKTMAQPLPPEYVPEGMYNQEIMTEDGIILGYELRELPAQEISYQNGNCVNGQECPGAPRPRPRPENLGEESCAINPDQTHCQAEDSIEKGGDDTNPDPDDDVDNSETRVADRGPTGPSQACQSALANTRQCSQAPQVRVGIPTGNILGNYDAAAQTMRNGSNTLSNYSVQCQALMNSCQSQCSTNNPFDSNLKSQCSTYQNQVQQAYSEAQHLNAMSTQVEQAAIEIRNGQSGEKSTLNIGQGIGIQAYTPTPIGDDATGIKSVSDTPLLSNVKMQSYETMIEEEEAEKEKQKALNVQGAKTPTTVSMAQLKNFKKTGTIKVSNPTMEVAALDKDKKDEVEYFDVSSRRMLKYKASGHQGRNQNLASGSSLQNTKIKRSQLATAEEILKKQWEEERRARGVASGTTRVDQFIFHTICLNYDNYERLFEINQGSSQCPPPR